MNNQKKWKIMYRSMHGLKNCIIEAPTSKDAEKLFHDSYSNCIILLINPN